MQQHTWRIYWIHACVETWTSSGVQRCHATSFYSHRRREDFVAGRHPQSTYEPLTPTHVVVARTCTAMTRRDVTVTCVYRKECCSSEQQWVVIWRVSELSESRHWRLHSRKRYSLFSSKNNRKTSENLHTTKRREVMAQIDKHGSGKLSTTNTS